ncbi:unnamed protein product [Pylaiella littoralis]
MIPGGLTPVVQPLDRSINKEFKRGMRAKYTHWVKDEFDRNGPGKAVAPSRGVVATWVKDVWANISVKTILSCFKVCGLTLNLDGSEDHDEFDDSDDDCCAVDLVDLVDSDSEGEEEEEEEAES